MDFEIKDGVLVKYNGSNPDIIIPSDVTAIDVNAFINNKFLKSVIITENVTVIGAGAFSECANLEKITISEGVTKINAFAFSECANLKKIVIPEGVTIISESAFENCCNLEKIVIPEGVTTIGDSAFKNCYNLKKIVIPNSVTTIGDLAFCDCYNLEKIVIPESVTEIGGSAFACTEWLENKTATEKNFVAVNGIVIQAADEDNIEESVNLEGIKEIKGYIFWGFAQIKEFVIPDGLKIGDSAFVTENDFNICLKHDDFSVNIQINKSEMIKDKVKFTERTESLFKFIGAGTEQRELLFDNLELPEYRYPIAVFMANAYKSEFFHTFVNVHFEKIIQYAENNDPDLLKLISR
ncbi:MAG: leucine-rich repeat domain-containing protein [Ruminococcus sp.]|nr:leucine-rich repeat domain-containing protein [Ruminococcus sp.]